MARSTSKRCSSPFISIKGRFTPKPLGQAIARSCSVSPRTTVFKPHFFWAPILSKAIAAGILLSHPLGFTSKEVGNSMASTSPFCKKERILVFTSLGASIIFPSKDLIFSRVVSTLFSSLRIQ